MPALLHDPFDRTARRLADKVAIVDGPVRLPYRDLQRRARTLAAALRADGVEPGDRVLLLLESGIDFAVAVHAVLVAGAVFVPLSAMTKPEKLEFIASDTRASALLTHALLTPTWLPVIGRRAELRCCRVAGNVDAGAMPARVQPWPADDADAEEIERSRIDQDLAALIYTSGTTGIPKGVMLTHLNMTSAFASIQAYLGYEADDVIGLTLPVAFSYGLCNLLMGLGMGATVVIERATAFPIRVAEMLERERVTVFPGVPTLFRSLVQLQNLTRFDFQALRLLTNAAAALPAAHLDGLREAFPRARVFCMYGLTECVRASYLPPDEIDRRPGSVGRGIPNQEHWLVDSGGLPLPNGSTGELVLRGSHVMRGYWERPVETDERLRPGALGERVLHTGDIFRTDSDGYLYFVARQDDIIKTRGEKVAPREVENVIYELEPVVGCAVIGIADDALGQAIKAYITLRPGSQLGARDVIKHCMSRLENYMVPKVVEMVDDLPLTESGKIRSRSLGG